MVFYINLGLFTLKYLLSYILFVESLTALRIKMTFILFICLSLIYALHNYKLDYRTIMEKGLYKIKDHIINLFIIILFICFFIGGILYLRILNVSTSRSINLISMYNKIHMFFINMSIFDAFFISICLLLIFITYVYIIKLIFRIFMYNVIKRHIYLCYKFKSYVGLSANMSLYTLKCLSDRITGYFVFRVDNSESEFVKKYHAGFLADIIFLENVIKNYVHYIIIFIVCIYDIIFNNFILIHLFTALLFAFLYESYKKISYFIYYMDFCMDEMLAVYIYKRTNIVFYDETTLSLNDDNICTIGDLYVLRNHYLKDGLYCDLNSIDPLTDFAYLTNEYNKAFAKNPEWKKKIKDIAAFPDLL